MKVSHFPPTTIFLFFYHMLLHRKLLLKNKTTCLKYSTVAGVTTGSNCEKEIGFYSRGVALYIFSNNCIICFFCCRKEYFSVEAQFYPIRSKKLHNINMFPKYLGNLHFSFLPFSE